MEPGTLTNKDLLHRARDAMRAFAERQTGEPKQIATEALCSINSLLDELAALEALADQKFGSEWRTA